MNAVDPLAVTRCADALLATLATPGATLDEWTGEGDRPANAWTAQELDEAARFLTRLGIPLRLIDPPDFAPPDQDPSP